MKIEQKILIELTQDEVNQILGTAVKQMFRISKEPDSDTEFETLSNVIKKCSRASLEIRSSPPNFIKPILHC